MNLLRARARHVLAALLSVGALVRSADANAQACLRSGCEAPPNTFYATVADENPAVIPQWTRGFAAPLGASIEFFSARGAGIPLAPGMYANHGRAGGPLVRPVAPLESDSVSPFAVGWVRNSGAIVRLAVDHGTNLATAGFSLGMSTPAAMGFWSDPAIGCSAAHCLGAVADRLNRMQLFRYATAIDPISVLLGGAVGTSTTPAAISRPAVAAIGSDRYAIARRHYDGDELIRVHDFDARTSAVREIGPLVEFARQTGAPESSIAAVADGGWLVVAWLVGFSGAREVRVAVLSVNPTLATTDGPISVAGPFTGATRTIGLARTRDNIVLTIQDGPTIYAVPMAINDSGALPRLAYRPFDATRDRVRTVGAAAPGAHRVASGAPPAIVWDEMDSGPVRAPVPRALGALLSWCTRPVDCVFTGGVGWTGDCATPGSPSVCVNAPPDSGVDSGVDARADTGVDTGVDVRSTGPDTGVDTGIDTGTSGPIDVALGDADATADDRPSQSDAPSPDAQSDATIPMDQQQDSASPADGSSPAARTPEFRGGACQCRAAGTGATRSSALTLASSLAAIALAASSRRSRRARRRQRYGTER
ncbi:MAG: hypothetical protein JNK05_02090 [Myxococcales bacterium]|nr:hypothetical protein [Myxococcales bacterium]